jgi:hypothetical protein
MKGSYKTSLAGIGTIVAGATAIFHMAQTKTYDSAQLTTAIGLIVAGLTGLFARDNSVSSEEVGATPQQKAAVASIHAQVKAASAAPVVAAHAIPVVSKP